MGKIIIGLLLAALLLAAAGQIHAAQPSEERGKKMDRIASMEKHRKTLPGETAPSALAATDPELVAIHGRLIFGDIANGGSLTARQAELVTLACLTASQAPEPLRIHVEAALNAGASPVEIKEAVYQTAPYAGFPRTGAALAIVNDVFAKRGIKMPLEAQGTVNEETRFADGLAVQKKIFGAENIEKMQAGAPAGQQQIVTNFLSAYCFGDFYTRKGLDLRMRELLVFSAIVSLGGCDPQAKAHAAANISVGNSKQNLVDALAVMLPYIGFPRTLNGLAQVNAAAPEK